LSTSLRVSLLCLAVAACSCAGHYDRSVFRSYIESEPSNLDPAFAVDVSSGRLCALLFDGLVRPGPGSEVEGGLAERWEISPDGLVYTFHLGNSRFSDGRPVTGSDVKRSLERLLRPDIGSPRGWILSAVAGAESFSSGGSRELAGIEAVDDSTLVIRLSRPFAPFLSMLAMPSAGVAPASSAAATADVWRSPVCSGPWKVQRWDEGERILLARNDRYARPPALERLEFRLIPERMTQVAEFEVGNLDQLSVPKAELKRWTTDPRWAPYIESQVELAVTYIGLNNSKTPFDDPRVRRALNYGLDLHSIVEGLMKGAAVPSAGAVPPGLRGNDPARRGRPYDPDRAERLLAEAGLGGGLSMEIWYRDGGGAEQVLEAVQAQLKRVGVDVTLVAREWGTLKEAVNHGVPDSYFLDWYADYPDAENFLFPLFYSGNWGGGGNRARYSNAGVDSMLVAAAAEADPGARYDLYRRIDEKVYEDAPWIYLWHPVKVEVHQPWVEGRILRPLFYGQRYTDVVKARRGGRGAG
jgi:ABC-type transport system substrate-binding protein